MPFAAEPTGGLSHPSRVRGLKRHNLVGSPVTGHVAPLAGAWIETFGV